MESERDSVSGMTAYDWACVRVVTAELDLKIAEANVFAIWSVVLAPVVSAYAVGSPPLPWWVVFPLAIAWCWWAHNSSTKTPSENLKKAIERRDSFGVW